MACAAPAIGITFSRSEDPFGIGHNHWFLFVVVTCFIITLLWTFFYLLQIRDFIKVKLPFTFLKVELIFTLVATVLYIIAFIVILSGYSWCSSSQKFGGSRECDARVAGGVSALSRLLSLLAVFWIFKIFNGPNPLSIFTFRYLLCSIHLYMAMEHI